MPNIQQYEAGDIGLRPTEIGVESTAQAARRAGAFYNQAAESKLRTGQMFGQAVKDVGDVAVEYATHQDKSLGAKTYADGFAALTQQWEDIKKNSDPNDPTIAAKFMKDNLEPFLDKFQQGFFTEGGQKWGENMAMHLRQHLTEKTVADMSILSGQATLQNMEQSTNKFGVSVYNSPDTHSLDAAIEGVKATFAANIDHNINLTAEQKLKLKEAEQKAIGQVIKAAVVGGSLRNSALGEKIASDPKYAQYVNASELSQITTAARRDQQYQRVLAKQEAIQRSSDNAAKIRLQWFDDNGNFKPDPHFMTKLDQIPDDQISKSDKSNLATVYNKTVMEEKKNAFDPDTLDDLRRRTTSDTNRTTISEVIKAEADHRVTSEQASLAISRIKGVEGEEGMRIARNREKTIAAYEGVIDPARMIAGLKSPEGSVAINRYEQALFKLEQEAVRNGKPASSVYEYGKDGVSQAGQLAEQFRVPLSALPDNLKRAMGVETLKKEMNLGNVTGAEVIDIPKGMSPADVIKNYKAGTQIRLPDGSLGRVPGGR